MPTKPGICPRNLIETSKVMSIAVGSDTHAWSAPVYYMNNRKGFGSREKIEL